MALLYHWSFDASGDDTHESDDFSALCALTTDNPRTGTHSMRFESVDEFGTETARLESTLGLTADTWFQFYIYPRAQTLEGDRPILKFNTGSWEVQYSGSAHEIRLAGSTATDYADGALTLNAWNKVKVNCVRGSNFTLEINGAAVPGDCLPHGGNNPTFNELDAQGGGFDGAWDIDDVTVWDADPGDVDYPVILPVYEQLSYRFFDDGDELPHYDVALPTITSATGTTDAVNGTTVTANYPATVGVGDLLIWGVMKDDDATGITDTTGGLTVIVPSGNGGSGSDGVCLAVWFEIADGNEDGTTRVFTGDSEMFQVFCLRILAGEFDPADPIGTVATMTGASSGATADTGAFTPDRTGSLVIAMGAVDADPMDATFSPTGWTDVADVDATDVTGWVSTKDAATVAGVEIAAASFGINANDAWAAAAFEVHALPVADGRAPFAAANTPVTLEVDTAYGISVRARVTTEDGDDDYRWQYRLNGGSWTDITSSSSVVKTSASADYTNGDDVPEYLGGSGTYVSNNNAALDTTGSLTLAAALPAGSAFESHLTFTIVSGDVADEDDIELRLVAGSATAFDTYTQTPTITVNEAASSFTATGAPALPKLTGASSGLGEQAAFGAPALSQLTATGSARMHPKGAAAGTLATLTATGTGVHEQTASGADALPQLAAAASSVVEQSASGAPALGQLAAVATGEADFVATGAPALPQLSAVAASTHEQTASGTPNLAGLAAAGSATVTATAVTSSGADTLPQLAATGTAREKQAASGSVSLSSLTATATGREKQTASGAGALGQLSATATAAADYVATGADSLPSLSATGTGRERQAASGVATLAQLSASAVGSADFVGTGAATLRSLTALATGKHSQTASGTPALAALATAGAATHPLLSTGASTLPQLVSSGALVQEQTSSGAATLSALTATGSGASGNNPIGSGAASLLAVVGAAAATVEQSASGSETLPRLSNVAAALVRQSASGTDTLSSLLATATGRIRQSSSGAVTTPQLVGSASATVEQTASGATTLAPLAATGTALRKQEAAGSVALAQLSAAGSARVKITAAGAPAIAGALSAGLLVQKQTATGAGSLGGLSCSGTATSLVGMVGSAAVRLAVLVVTGAAVHTVGHGPRTIRPGLYGPAIARAGEYGAEIVREGSYGPEISRVGSYFSDSIERVGQYGPTIVREGRYTGA